MANEHCLHCPSRVPALARRLYSVWYRHIRVYGRHLFSNGLPPFLEPLFFLAGIGLGMGAQLAPVDSVPYLVFLAGGMLAPAAMYTAAFECTYGTFERLMVDKVYDGMLGASISESDLIIGELLFVGTKGFFFTTSVLLVLTPFGLVTWPEVLLAPFVGFATGVMFGALGLVITSLVSTISQFNIFMTGFLTPMFFFSGMVFPLANIPVDFRWLAEALPLTHAVRLVRAAALARPEAGMLFSLVYCLVFCVLFSWLAVLLLRRRLRS